MRYVVFALLLVLLIACVEKTYLPQETAAQERGNKYYWLFNRGMGVEMPKGWKIHTKGQRAEHYSRITGGADYVAIREDNPSQSPMIVIRKHNLAIEYTPATIERQVAVKQTVDRIMGKLGIHNYELTGMEYDKANNIFIWEANYSIESQKNMYDGLSLSEQMDARYGGIPQYRKITTEYHFKSASFFVGKYEVDFVLADGLVYFSDKPMRYVEKYQEDFREIIRSVAFK